MKFHYKSTHSLQTESNAKELTPQQIQKRFDNGKKYLFEYLDSNNEVKPYFDIDIKQDFESDSNEIINKATDILDKLFNKKCIYAIDDSSGWDIKDDKKYYKISTHLIIQDFKLNLLDLKSLLDKENLFPFFDSAVYRNGQSKFRVGGFNPFGTRKSKIIRGNVTDFIIQDVDHIKDVKDIKNEFDLTPQPTKSKNTNIKKTTNIIMDKNIKIEDLKNYSEIKTLLKMIGAIDDYGDWFKVSCIIKNTDERFYPLWVEWCKLSNQYNENGNDKIWAGLAVNGSLKMGSLHHIARSKNPDEYFRANYFEIVDQWWDQDELGIANIYASLFNNELKCVSQKKGLFYVYNKKTCLWSLKNEGCLHATIAENMRPVFHRYIKFMKSSDNVSESDMEKVKEITKVSLKLSKASFLKSVITILKGVEEIKNEDFQKILGSRLDILSVKNGVIDLRTGKLRKREFDDYLTEFINLEYTEDDINEDWEHFINDVFDNKKIKDQKAVVDFLQVFLGYSITGNTNQQLFMINYGAGSNGKTVLTNIINAIFSNNVANVSSEILDKNVGGNNANSASPEIAKLFLKRLGIINESEDNMTLGANFKKLIDKNNEYPARPLYGDPFTFILMASFILNTNNLPTFPVIDDSFIRRLLTVPFLNKYKIKSEMRGDDKEIDRGLEDKILKNKNGVLCWFVKGAVKYYANNEKLPAIPDDLQAATSKYVDDNDFTKAFEFTNSEKDFIPTTDIYQILNENYGIKISKKELKDALTKRGAISKKGFGYKKNVHGFRCLKSKFYQDEDLETDSDSE